MSKAKHTAGPWRAVIPAGYGKDTLIMSGTDIVASLIRFEGKAANARLIAASPEMYALLVDIVATMERMAPEPKSSVGVHLKKTKELIKKIEG